MAHGAAPNTYGDYGSVPTRPDAVTPPEGSGAGPMRVQASPQDFGAQIGKGVENVGNAGEQVANQFGGLIMETAANQAELSYIKASGDLKAKYQQYEGLQAEAMRPQYEADLANLHQQFRGNLPMLAAKMFDSNTIRSLGNQTSEYAGYAAGQVKGANLASNDALADAAIAKAGNLPTVTDPAQFGEANATIIHAVNAVADIKGWASVATGTDSETGKLTFGDDAQTVKTQYEQYLAEKQSKLYLTAAKTVADNHGAAAAAEWAKLHWDMMPDVAKVQMNQYLAPKMKNEAIGGNIASQNAALESGWNDQLTSKVPTGPTDGIQKNALEVIRQNEGYTGKVGKDSNGYQVLNGINEKYFPKEFAEAQNLLATKGKDAADKYADNFYQKNILDKYDIKSLPPSTQAVVADGLVNHGTGAFGQSLITAAKGGATPQQLIDMRRDEYQRLARENPAQYGASLKGWNNRLDSFEHGQAFANKKDYLESQRDDYVQNTVNGYLAQYPEDYYGAQIQEKRATAEINRQIATEGGKLKSDRDNIDNAIGGAFTKGKSPMTQAELNAIPGMQPVLERVAREQGEFYKSIDTKIAKASHGELSVNGPNAYDAFLTALDTTNSYPRQQQIEYLSKGLGSDNPGYSLSWKDFQDAKPAVDLDDTTKSAIHDEMKNIAAANGNVDGKGQQRAVQYYTQIMGAIKANKAKGDSAENEMQVIKDFNDKIFPPPPSRTQQIENWASSLFKGKQPANIVNVVSPDGVNGTIPAENLDKALAAGYKRG